MAKRTQPTISDVAYAAVEFVAKHKLDTNEPTHLASVAAALKQSPALLLRLIRIQNALCSPVTTTWRTAARVDKRCVSLSAMEWLVKNYGAKSDNEQCAAFDGLLYGTDRE